MLFDFKCSFLVSGREDVVRVFWEKGNVDQRWGKDNAGRHKYTPGLKYKYKTNTNTASTVCKNEIGETRSEVGGGECRRRPNPP